MIVTETITINDKQYVHTYSDSGLMIRGGSPDGDYCEAYDPAEFGRTYVETDIPVEVDNEELLNVLVGVEE